MTILRDADSDAGFYLSIRAPQITSWPGAAIYRSDDAGATWASVGSVAQGAIEGTTASAVAACPIPHVWDYNSTVRVTLTNTAHTLSSTSIAFVKAGANFAKVGKELLQFRTATSLGSGVYLLSNLLRGRKGTEWATGTHVAGERFVLMTTATARPAQGVVRVPGSNSDVGTKPLYQAVSNGTASPSAADATAIRHTGEALRPWRPAHLRARALESGNISITWRGRSRFTTPTGLAKPLPSEAPEAYRVEIYNAARKRIRTISASSTSATYTAAQQATDFPAGRPSPLEIVVVMLSPVVGRGIGKRVTVI